MNITRRQFLKLLAVGVASAAVPAFSNGREPYVLEGEVVDYAGHHPGGFLGGQIVESIGDWDGVGYPTRTWNNAYGSHRAIETYYDFDLANFNREIPDRFWHNPINSKRYNNVHTYLREQRFGETIDQAIKHLNFAQSRTT